MAEEKNIMQAILQGRYGEAFRLLTDTAPASRTAREHYLLHYCYLSGLGTKPDFEKAKGELVRAAAQDDPLALTDAYCSFEERYLIAGNEEEFLGLVEGPLEEERAAGNPLALRALALLTEEGIGRPRSAEKAEALYREAAEAGLAPAAFDAAAMYGRPEYKNEEKLFFWLEKGAEAGHVQSMVTAGKLCLRGEGTEKDERKAASYFRQAAENGADSVLLLLGVLEKEHPEWETAPEKTFEALEKGLALYPADGEAGRACLALGDCFREGFGTERDPEKALKWYKKGEEKGQSLGGVLAAKLWYDGDFGPGKEKRAFSQMKRSAKDGDARAMYFLGRFLAEGIGTAADGKQAEEWFRRASNRSGVLPYSRLGREAEKQGLLHEFTALIRERAGKDGSLRGAEPEFPKGKLGSTLSVEEAQDWLDGETARRIDWIKKEIGWKE